MSTNQLANPVCDICLEPFTDPRILLCLHSFCRLCLEKELEKGPGEAITCPTCQRSIPLPEGGILALPKNLHLASEVEIAKYSAAMETSSDIKCDSCSVETNRPSKAFCCTCREFLCQFCWDYHRASRQLQSHDTIPLTKDAANQLPSLVKPLVPSCTEHGEALKFYCKVCHHTICQACITGPQSPAPQSPTPKHGGHTYTSVAAAASDHRRRISEALESACGTLARLADDTGASSKVLRQVEATRRRAAARVEADFDIMVEALRARRATVLASLDRAMQVCGQPFRERSEDCSKAMAAITQYKEAISHALGTHTDDELIALDGLFAHTLDNVLNTSENLLSLPLQLVPTVTTHTTTSTILDEIEKVGVHVVCPAQSSWVQAHTSPPTAGTQYQLKLESRDSQGGRMAVGGLEVRAELRPNMDDQPCIRGDVEDHGDGTYTITLTPLTTGCHHLCITIHGHHILNSPCDLHVVKSYKCWKSIEMTIAVEQPFFVALDDSGNIYVTSGGKHSICVYDAVGRPKSTIGERGSGNGQFSNPRGIAIKGDVMYIADYSNNRVQKLTTGGTYLLAFGHEGSGEEGSALKGPLGVCVDREERVIVADYGNHRIQLYSSNGVSLHTINGSTGVMQFVCPCAVAVDPHGNVHVAAKPHAQNTTAVTVFSPSGAYVRSYGALRNAMSIDVHRTGQSVVCEYGKRNAVQIFGPDGEQLGAVQTEGSVFALALDKDCSLYVTMHQANKLAKY